MFEEKPHTLRSLFREHRLGIYVTISVHLLLVILFLLYNIDSITRGDLSFVLDFSKQEAKVAKQEKDERRKTFEKEINKIVGQSSSNAARNVAVDQSEKQGSLRDDRHTDPSAIYDEARKVQERLDASRRAAEQQQGGDIAVAPNKSTPTKSETYKGPSVLSYDLGGRKAMRMPVPVYQCQGGGDVTVLIEVDRRGYVVNTTISINGSVDNDCLHAAARRAASTSRFAANANAPQRQKGHIIYRFVKQ